MDKIKLVMSNGLLVVAVVRPGHSAEVLEEVREATKEGACFYVKDEDGDEILVNTAHLIAAHRA